MDHLRGVAVVKRRKVDVLVLGGGAGGLAAATQAAEHAGRVALIDREPDPGGVLDQCIHHGFGLQRYREELTGPEFAHRLRSEFDRSGAQFFGNMCGVAIQAEARTVVALGPDGRNTFEARSVVLATGARERPFGALQIPGFRASGILTAGVAQRLVNIEGVLPGRRAIVLGSGDIGLIMARRLHLEGMEVVGVLEQRPFPGGLLRNVVQCLEDFRIPLLLKHTVIRVHGRGRLEGVTVTEVDESGAAIPSTERFLEADTLILSVGLIPDNELVAGLVGIDDGNGGIWVDSQMRTEVEWLYAAGNNIVVFDLADWVAQVGEVAGRNAALACDDASVHRRIPLVRGDHVLHLVPGALVPGDEARLLLRVDEPMGKAELRIGGLVSRPLMGTRPSEMLEMKLTAEQVDELCSLDEIHVEVVPD
jgi:NADPH-dependent 2,4-dienoyl-CoA reductase/sulfur reductase-like enzyme